MTQRTDSTPGRFDIRVLETARLILRPHLAEDFEFVAAMWANPEVVRYIGEGKPLSRDEAWLKFQRFPGHWYWTGFGSWAIEERASGRLVGETGFHDRKRERAADFAGIPDAGWALVPEAAGKGYATEAVKALLAWGRTHFGPARVLALCEPANAASIHVAEKCGFSESRVDTSGGRPRLFLERTL